MCERENKRERESVCVWDAERGEGNQVRDGEMAEGVALVVAMGAEGGSRRGREGVAVVVVRGRKTRR